MFLHMQQVLCCELTKAEDAQEVEVGQVAGVLPVQVTKRHNAYYPLQGVQVCVPNLRWLTVVWEVLACFWSVTSASSAMKVCAWMQACTTSKVHRDCVECIRTVQ